MELRQVEVAGRAHGYREAGSGRPVVFLHGILADSRFWEPQLEGLSDVCRAIAWDAPGVGGSFDPARDLGIPGYAAALNGFLAATGASPATLVGLSWGGILALEFYRRHPGDVAGLVLADTYAGWKGSLGQADYESRRARALRQLAEDAVPAGIPGVIHPDAPAEARRLLEEMMRDARAAGFQAMGRAMLDVDASDVLGRIEVPTLLLWGEEDERSPMAVALEMERSIPGARLAKIPGAGHVSSLEKPEAFDSALRDFLEGSTS